MDHIRKLAWISIARGCGFGTLAIFCFMFGFITTPGIAFDAAGFGFLLMAVVLMIKASRSGQLSYRRTELWIMLEPDQRPPPEVAAPLIMRARQEVMLRCAYLSSKTALCCLVLAAAIQMAGYR